MSAFVEKVSVLRAICFLMEHLRRWQKKEVNRLAAPRPNRVRKWVGPKVGVLSQHTPKPLKVPSQYVKQTSLKEFPKISIVTASLNQGQFIGRTIQSVITQNYPSLQYVIRDGGSTDNTLNILQHEATDSVQWFSEKDNGQTDALNQGFKLTDGEIMAYLNADDLLLPGALKFVADYFVRHPEVDVIYGNRILIDEVDSDIGKWILPPHDDEVVRWVDYIPQETLFWRRSLWEKVGGSLNENFQFAMDWELLLRFIGEGAHFARVIRYLGAFRVHELQKTSSVMHSQGFDEIDRLLFRSHGREVKYEEVIQNVCQYNLKQIYYDHAIRCIDFFRPKIDCLKELELKAKF